MRAIARWLILALLFAAAPALAQSDFGSAGDERILSFVSDVHIAKSGTLDVTETIRVRSTGNEIKRGIQRDFPTRYRDALGQTTSTTFNVVSVERDGRREPHSLINLNNGYRVRIGDANVFLNAGEHVFVIRYTTSRQLIFGKDKDELYWNATGTGWTFPIDLAEARITLPAPATFGNRAVYTGPQRATARNAQVIQEKPGYIVFQTTQPLGREEGLTVAAAFPKGIVDAPSSTTQLGWWLQDWGALLAAGIALLALGAYYYHAWKTVGRGPRAGPVVPAFSPPEGITAAAARYISRMRMDNRAFTAAIVELGVRRQIHIRKDGGGWFSSGTTTLKSTRTGDDLPDPERAMVAALFSGGDTIELKQENHSTLQTARSALEKRLKDAYSGKLFRSNAEWAVYGLLAIPLAIMGVSLVAIAVSVPAASPSALGMPILGAALFIAAAWLHGLTRRTSGAVKALAWIGVAFAIFAAFPVAFISVVVPLVDGKWPVLLPLLALPLAFSAFAWMYAPTVEGRAMMDRIAGFKHYLGIAEEDRLEVLHPPEKTPELFERYLPYAIALDVENRWANKFTAVLAAAAAAGAASHTMGWYSGGGNVWDNPGDFASSVGSSLNSTISSASTSPSSSGGGSSGGGSSGGGGGGGGGSGW